MFWRWKFTRPMPPAAISFSISNCPAWGSGPTRHTNRGSHRSDGQQLDDALLSPGDAATVAVRAPAALSGSHALTYLLRRDMARRAGNSWMTEIFSTCVFPGSGCKKYPVNQTENSLRRGLGAP